MLRSQIEVRHIVLVRFVWSLNGLRLFRSQRLLLFPRRCFFALLPAALARGFFSCLLAFVFHGTLPRDGQLTLFLALDIAEDLAGRATSEIFFRSLSTIRL